MLLIPNVFAAGLEPSPCGGIWEYTLLRKNINIHYYIILINILILKYSIF